MTLPTPSGSQPGGFLDFVREGVGLAVEEGDLVFFRERAVTTPVTCAAEDVPGLPGGPSCISEGEQFDGMPNAFFESETRLIDVEDVIATLELLFTEAMPSAWEVQDGAVELRSAETFATAITAIVELPADAGGAGPARATLVLNWADMNGDLRLVSVVSSLMRGEAMLMQTIASWPVWEAAQP